MNDDEHHEQPLFDEALLSRMLGIQDARTLATFYELFLQQAWPLLDLLHPDTQARDVRAVEKLAHKLKSSAHSVGAIPLSETLGQIEQLCRTGDTEGLARQLTVAHPLAGQTLAAIADLQLRLAAQTPD